MTDSHNKPSKPDSKTAHHHTHEWTSGTRGGGKVPADLRWNTNPKQRQEEHGASSEKTKPGSDDKK